MKVFLLLPLLGLAGSVYGHHFNSSDSILLKAYGSKIVPKAIQSKTDVLYVGIENNVAIQFPDDEAKKMNLFLTASNGLIEKKGDSYLLTPKNTGKCIISVKWITSENDTVLIRKKVFEAKRIPDPVLKIGNTVIKNQDRIGRVNFSTGDSVKLFFTDDLLINDKLSSVHYFSIGYNYGGVYISNDNDGAAISQPNIKFINNIAPGKEVIIRVLSATKPKEVSQLPMIRFYLL